MRQAVVLLAVVALAFAQDDLDAAIGSIFTTPAAEGGLDPIVDTDDGIKGGVGAIERCGDDNSKGRFVCVPYYQCDGQTKTIIRDGTVDGGGVIDIRLDDKECDHYLDVCCQDLEDGKVPLPTPNPEPTEPPPVATTKPGPTRPTKPTKPTPTRPTPPRPTPSRPTPPVVGPPVIPPGTNQCGVRYPQGIDFKIEGNNNNEAEYGEFPWMMAIVNKHPSGKEGGLTCGGSLIHPQVVLTGAHCVYKQNIATLKVRAGEWDTQTNKERVPYQERNIREVRIHKDYVTQVLYNDMALLILDRPFDQAENIGTVCLPTQNYEFVSRNCFASGWGKVHFGVAGENQVILKKIELPVVDKNKCQEDLRRTRLGPKFTLHRSFMCAGGEAGKDTCTGDGGSPLVCPDPSRPGRYQQAGIVAWGIGCGENGVPGVYADVSLFREWIDQQMIMFGFGTATYTE